MIALLDLVNKPFELEEAEGMAGATEVLGFLLSSDEFA